MEQRLKEAVERIVGPIPASERKKDRLREELWGHLQALYNEEYAHDESADAALARALARLGEARTIRRSFLQSLSYFERLYGYLDYRFGIRPGMKRFHKGVEAGGFGLAVGVGCSVLIAMGIALLKGGDIARILNGFAFGIAFALWQCGWLFAFYMLLPPYREALASNSRSISLAKTWLRYQAVWACVMLAVSWIAWYAARFAHQSILGEHSARALELSYASAVLYGVLAAVLTILMPAAVMLEYRMRKPIRDWPYDLEAKESQS